MEVLWTHGPSSADQIRRRLARKHDLTDSTIRTILRRLESKGYAGHEKEGNRFIYTTLVKRMSAAAAAAKKIIDSICGGSAEELLVGMVESEMISAEEIESIRKRLESEES
jgi:BlaI family penicillinase repressor